MGSSLSKCDFLYELHEQKYEIFKAQDPETGGFDVVLEIGGKKLYAHKYKLCEFSTTIDAMLSERWTTQNEPIEKYSFDDFKKFVGFLYSGECEFSYDNIFAIDIAEFYNVPVFKKACEYFLIFNIKRDIKNVYQMLELAYKYSLECLKESLFEFISTNLLSFAKTEQLISLPHSIIYDIVESSQNTVRQEELFEMVYIWAENKATEKQKSDPNLNINEAIKEELSDILQFFKFKMINHGFVMKFVVSKSFLFSGAELCDILSESRRVVTFIDENGKMAKGVLDCDDNEKMFHIIQSKKNLKGPVWKVEEPLPSSKLIENDSIDWYLTYYKCDEDCYFMVKNRSVIVHCDVSLLAELIAEDEFQHENCKIV